MANTPLAQAAAGTIVKTNENSLPVEFYVGAIDYQSGLNGKGRTLFVRKTPNDARVWSAANKNTYNDSDIDVWLNGEYKAFFDEDVQADMGSTSFPYTVGGGNNSVETISKSIFLLSVTELGKSAAYANEEGTAIPIASQLENAGGNQWTRTPNTTSSNYVCFIQSTAQVSFGSADNTYMYHPAFTLGAANWEITEDGTLVKASSSGGNTPLKDIPAGSVVKTKENGSLVEFIVLQQGYASSAKNTLLLRKDIYGNMQFGGVSAYSGSDIDNFLQNDYLLLLEESVRERLVSVSIPCYSSGKIDNINRSAFLLSGTELGFSADGMPVEGSALSYFNSSESRIAYFEGSASNWYTRSISTYNGTYSWYVLPTGTYFNSTNTTTNGIRPALCLPSDGLYVTDSGELTEDPGAGVMLIPASKLEQGVEYNFRIFPRNYQNQFQTGIDGSVVSILVEDGQEADGASTLEKQLREMKEALTVLGVNVNA